MKVKFKKLGIFETFITGILLIGITTLLYLYTSGYRLNKNDDKNIDLSKTGMIGVKSLPEGASVYLDEKLITATDDTISGVKPGIHNLKITKNGYIEWNKDIEVFEELVTDMTAVLVSQSPRLEPLTNTGAHDPSLSPTFTKLAYFSTDTEKPGIWVIPLTSNGISLFRSNPTIAIQDTKFTKYSQGKTVEWSPDEKELLVEGANNVYYIVNLETNTAQTTVEQEKIKQEWETVAKQKRDDLISKLEITSDVKQLATSTRAVWAPDEKKFLYTTQVGSEIEYRVYNLEKPLPVGEKEETLVLKVSINSPQPKLTWYSDSFHLIMVEGNVAADKKGTISIIRIDGTNKVEIYNNTLYSDAVFSAPSGDKVIMLTSFKSSGQTDLYTVSIR